MRAPLAALVAVLLTAACTAPIPAAPRANVVSTPGGGQPSCIPQPGRPAAETPTTIDVVEQAYHCILTYYYNGPTLEVRPLLQAGFAVLTQELNREGRDVAEADMPALTGDRYGDWAAFEQAYRKTTDALPEDLRGRLAAATMRGIVAALGDDHARWSRDVREAPDSYDDDLYGLGLKTSITSNQATNSPGTALPPLFVTTVLGGQAKEAGLRPGDVITAVNGSAPFIGTAVTTAAVNALYPAYPEADPVRITVKRPGTARAMTVTLKPGLFRPDPDLMRRVSSKVVGGDLAYVRLTGFSPDAATKVFKAIDALRAGRTLSGLVLDLRGNTGGSPEAAVQLVSAFGHGKVTAYQCAGDGSCTTSSTDNGIELLNLPLVVLTDRNCASACDHFTSAIKDLRLGTLVGTRTAGIVSGPAQPYLLSDNTMLSMPSRHHLGPNREQIDRVGVAPDHHVPPTAADVAAGRDRALAKAVALLHQGRTS